MHAHIKFEHVANKYITFLENFSNILSNLFISMLVDIQDFVDQYRLVAVRL